MDLPDKIRAKIKLGMFEFSKHTLDHSIIRGISVEEIRQVFETANLLEDYPVDKYGPSCLLFAQTRVGRLLHILCTHPSRPLIKIITLYEPDGTRWFRGRLRVDPPKQN